MSFIPTPNVVRFAIKGTIGTSLMVNTLWFQLPQPALASDILVGCTQLSLGLDDQLKQLFDAGWQVTNITGYAQDSDTAPMYSLDVVPPLVGSYSNTNPMGPQVAAVLTFHTANRGRTGRGRIYWAGIHSAICNGNGTLTNVFIADLEIGFAAITGLMSAQGFTHVVVSHYHNKTARAEGLAQRVTSYTMDPNCDTQRRRAPGRGQ